MKRRNIHQPPDPKPDIKRPCIAIIMDCGKDDVSTLTLSSLLSLTNKPKAANASYKFISPQSDDKNLSLNLALNETWNDKSITHFMIVDPNIGFDPVDIKIMLSDEVPLSGLYLPLEELSLKHIYDLGRSGSISADENPTVLPNALNGPAFRLLLGKRETLDIMVKAGCVQRLSICNSGQFASVDTGRQDYLGFVSPIRQEGSNRQLVQKAAFIYRWQAICKGGIGTPPDLSMDVIDSYRLDIKFKDAEAYP